MHIALWKGHQENPNLWALLKPNFQVHPPMHAQIIVWSPTCEFSPQILVPSNFGALNSWQQVPRQPQKSHLVYQHHPVMESFYPRVQGQNFQIHFIHATLGLYLSSIPIVLPYQSDKAYGSNISCYVMKNMHCIRPTFCGASEQKMKHCCSKTLKLKSWILRQ